MGSETTTFFHQLQEEIPAQDKEEPRTLKQVLIWSALRCEVIKAISKKTNSNRVGWDRKWLKNVALGRGANSGATKRKKNKTVLSMVLKDAIQAPWQKLTKSEEKEKVKEETTFKQ